MVATPVKSTARFYPTRIDLAANVRQDVVSINWNGKVKHDRGHQGRNHQD